MSWNEVSRQSWKPLEGRTYRYKKAALEFFCPLCRTQRVITIGHKLTTLNYIQILLLTAAVTALSFPWAGFRALAVIFPLWLGFEMVRRALFSREIPCPHCGFDASWYKRDVLVARRRVSEFWSKKNPAPVEEPVESEA